MSDGHIEDLLEAIRRAEKHHGDANVQKILTNKKLPGDLLSVRHSMKNSFKKTIDDPLEPFRDEYMGWKYAGCGTLTMSKIGFPAFFYKMPKALCDPVLSFMLKEKVLIMSCLFQASSSGVFALVAFNAKFLNKKCRTAEMMFFDQKGESICIQQNLNLSYLTIIRIQQFVLNKENLGNVLKAVLATDLSTSVAYTTLGKFSDYALQTEKQAVYSFRQSKLMFTRLKREIKRIIDRGGSPETRTLNNLELVQNNMQVLHASISKFHSRLSKIHHKNTILLHELHREIRKLYNVQAEMYKLRHTDREESDQDLSLYYCLSDCSERKRQISFELELLVLRAKENESLFQLACDRLENSTLLEARKARPQTSRRKQTLI